MPPNAEARASHRCDPERTKLSTEEADQFEKLRIDYLPSFEDLRISPDVDTLVMTIGDPRLRKLAAAFASVEVGGGDFDIKTSNDRKADPWMFWWMPNIDYRDGEKQ